MITVPGCLGLLTTQVMCEEFSQCYDDVNICLWTNGTVMAPSAASEVCQQRNSFLPRITNSNIQSKLAEFRSADQSGIRVLNNAGFWIDVYTVAVDDFHWIDGSSLAGLLVSTAELLRWQNCNAWDFLPLLLFAQFPLSFPAFPSLPFILISFLFRREDPPSNPDREPGAAMYDVSYPSVHDAYTSLWYLEPITSIAILGSEILSVK